MELARQLVDVAAEAGADCVKFQKRNVATLAVGPVLDAEDDRFPSLGATYREVRESLEFDLEQYRELKGLVEVKGMDFLCTAFDVKSVDFLEKLEVDAYKMASHSNTNTNLLRYVAALKKPVVLSTGACTVEELDDAVAVFKEAGAELTLLHCVSSYPTPVEQMNLAMIDWYTERYGVPVGYSGHEIGYLPTLSAAARGAVAVERHFTVDNTLPGFDHKLSLMPEELKAMIEAIRSVETSIGTVETGVAEFEKVTRGKYKVSMVSAGPIPRGAVLTEEVITYKNPGTGIYPKDAGRVLGKRTVVDIPGDTLIDEAMVG
jgi:sialic acid synthase SpsE